MKIRLTPDQKRLMIILCNAAETGDSVRLINQGTQFRDARREKTIANSLIRKGFVVSLGNDRFEVTSEGFWEGDGLRILDRQGRVPPRKQPGKLWPERAPERF